MNEKINFGIRAAHEYFSKYCFNSAWELIDKKSRTAKEDEEMIRLAQASLFHWTQRVDCTDQNLSTGYWLLSRVYALAGDTVNAIKYGRLCLKYSQMYGVAEVFLGYAYEALTRSLAAAGEVEKKSEYMAKARAVAEKLSEEDKAQLLGELETI